MADDKKTNGELQTTFSIYGGYDHKKRKIAVAVSISEPGEPQLKFDRTFDADSRAAAVGAIHAYVAEVRAYLTKRGM